MSTTIQYPTVLTEAILVPSNLDYPHYIHKTLYSSATLVPQLLDGRNYCAWARSMPHALSVQNKLGSKNETLTELKDLSDLKQKYAQ